MPRRTKCSLATWQSIRPTPSAREPLDQGHESDLRGVRLPMKHRLAAEAAADANAVDSSDQLTISPALHAMGVTKLVEPVCRLAASRV